MRATRNDVARLAGVSGSIVSYVFNKTRPVAKETEKRILAAAKALDYQPDLIARSMVTKETQTISIVTDDIVNPLMLQIIKGIQEAAFLKNYFVNICGGEKNLESYVDNFISRRVDGVFVSVNPLLMREEYINKLVDRNISLIEIATRFDKNENICLIETDYQTGMKSILDYLISLNHHKIVYLSAFDSDYLYDRRLNVFKQLYSSLFDSEPLVIEGAPPYESTTEQGYNMTASLLKSGAPVTAIICTNDLMAIGSIRAISDAGLRIPQDISVVGIDNIHMSKYVTPPLTTLDTLSHEFGQRIFELLYDNMKKGIVSSETFGTNLVVRDSCGFAPF